MATTMAFQPLSPSGSCTSRTECSKMPRLLAFLMVYSFIPFRYARSSNNRSYSLSIPQIL